MKATYHGDGEIVRLFMDHNADINARASPSETALTVAAKFGSDDIVRMLLRHPERDLRLFSVTGLKEAVQNQHIEVVQELQLHPAVLTTTTATWSRLQENRATRRLCRGKHQLFTSFFASK